MRTLLLILIIVVFCGCAPDLYELLAERAELPQEQSPLVYSLAVAGGIRVSWQGDRAADCYLLYRSLTPQGVVSLIYEGGALEYLDRNIELDRVYYYSLALRKGEREFARSGLRAGVSSSLANDSYEPNESLEQAAPLDATAFGVVYSYNDGYTGLTDSDWYFVDLAAYEGCRVSLTGLSGISDNELLFRYRGASSTIVEGKTFLLQNLSESRRREYFMIAPATGSLNRSGSYVIKTLYIIN